MRRAILFYCCTLGSVRKFPTKIIDIQIGKMSAAVISLFLGGGEYREKMQVLPIGSSKYQYQKFLLRISPRFYLFLNELSWKVSPVFVQKRFYYLCMNIFCCGTKRRQPKLSNENKSVDLFLFCSATFSREE